MLLRTATFLRLTAYYCCASHHTVHMYASTPHRTTQRRMFLKFYPEEGDAAENFAIAMTGAKVSMAMLQGFFMAHRGDGPMGALAATHLLRDEAEQVRVVVFRRCCSLQLQLQFSGLLRRSLGLN